MPDPPDRQRRMNWRVSAIVLILAGVLSLSDAWSCHLERDQDPPPSDTAETPD